MSTATTKKDEAMKETVEPVEPKSDLGKLLMVLVQEVGSMSPLAFREINVRDAIEQADRLGEVCDCSDDD